MRNPTQIDGQKLNKYGQEALKILEDHFISLSNQPITPRLKPGVLAEQFPQKPPSQGRNFLELLDDIKNKILPGLGQWQHPGFFAYYPSATSIPAILGELLLSGMASVGLQWSSNPIATELECVVMDWLMLALHADDRSPFLHRSKKGGGIIQNTAGDSMVAIMTAARIKKHRDLCSQNFAVEPDIDWLSSQDSSKLVVYMSDQVHFSALKAARVAGMRVHKIPCKSNSYGNVSISRDQVEQQIDLDKKMGLIPCLIFLNYGTTNTCGFDDIASFYKFGEKEGVWIHVDAAYAGSSLILPQFKEQSKTIQEVSDSFNLNGSKWLLCGFDSAFLFVKDRKWLKDAFSATGSYLAETELEEVYNPEFRDWSVPLGRRFRALKIWLVIEYFGIKGLQQFLQSAIDQANWLRQQIDESSAFQQTVKTNLGLVCFHLTEKSEKTLDEFLSKLNQIIAQQQKSFLVYPSLLNNQKFIRLALGGTNTNLEHIKEFWSLCCQALC